MKYLLTVLLLSSLTASAIAQITITDSEFIGEYYGVNNAQGYAATQASLSALAAILRDSGANQTWDFTGATYIRNSNQSTSTLLTYTGNAPLANDTDFIAATNVIETVPANPSSPTNYDFEKFTSSGAWSLGSSQDSEGMVKKEGGWIPPMQDAAFPMTYKTHWQSQSTFDDPQPHGSITSTTSVSAIVDGYGTLITPGHSDAALCVKTQSITTFTSDGQSASDTFYFYNFYTSGGYSALLLVGQLGANAPQKLLGARYSVPSNSSVSQQMPPNKLTLRLSQNPVSNTAATIIYTMPKASPVQIELIDMLGRSVRMLENGFEGAGEHSVPIDSKTLAAGTYFVRVEADGESAMRKFVIQ